jgi:heme/copper-type cytochrome/quinol oxidase subunit 2
MNVSLKIFMIVLAICGLVMLIAGWSAAVNANNCPETKESAENSARTALALGTVLLVSSSFYFVMLTFYNQSNLLINTKFNKDSVNKNYGLLAVFTVLSIIGITLSSIIIAGKGNEENKDEDQKKACSNVKSSGIVILIPSIIIMLMCIAYFVLYIYKK